MVANPAASDLSRCVAKLSRDGVYHESSCIAVDCTLVRGYETSDKSAPGDRYMFDSKGRFMFFFSRRIKESRSG